VCTSNEEDRMLPPITNRDPGDETDATDER
jgi:hypothetical protein